MTNKLRTFFTGWAVLWIFPLFIQTASLGCSCGRTGGTGPDDAHELTGFGFSLEDNPDLTTDVIGEIAGDQVTVIVPEGTDRTSLVANFTYLGGSVSVAGVPQESGVTQGDFSDPVVYRVTARDGTFSDYTVRVFDAASDARDLVRFRVLGVDATITGTDVALTLPFGTDRSALAPEVTITGVSVSPASGAVVDFTDSELNPVIYTVSAADGATRDYAVRITVAASDARDLVRFRVLGVDATITGTDVALTLPFGTDRSALAPEVTITGVSVSPASGAVVDFTDSELNPVIYTVSATDGGTRAYAVRITVAASDARDLVRFRVLGVDATITGTDVALTLPFGTDRSALAPEVTITGVSVSPASGAVVDFTDSELNPVIYTVSAADGGTRAYAVRITVAASDARDLVSFSFRAADNGPAGLLFDAPGQIVGQDIVVTVNHGTDVTGLVADFVHTGIGVTVAGVPQVARAAVNDFSSPVVYTVSAADGGTRDFTVTVQVAPASAKDLTAFVLPAALNPALAHDAIGLFTGTDVVVIVPTGTDLTALVPVFTTTGVRVDADAGGGPVTQTSGVSTVDFSLGSVAYIVTAGDGSQKYFNVDVVEAGATDRSLLSFAFLTADNPGLARDCLGVVTEGDPGAVSIQVPFGTPLTNLRPRFTSSGVGVTVSGAVQISGVTANDFTSVLTYRVTADDASTRDYLVSVTVAPGDANSLTAFSFETASNPGLIARAAGTVTEGAPGAVAITVPYGTGLGGLVASFTTTGSRVTVGGVTQLSGASPQDFSAPLVFTVHAADGGTRDYLVTVTVAPHTPPVVIATFPRDGATGTNLRVTFSVTFSERMRPATLTANTANTTCAGYTFQVSRDDFATCLRLKNFNVTNNPMVTFQPRTNMLAGTPYKIRVLGGPSGVACDDFGVNMISNHLTSFTTR